MVILKFSCQSKTKFNFKSNEINHDSNKRVCEKSLAILLSGEVNKKQ